MLLEYEPKREPKWDERRIFTRLETPLIELRHVYYVDTMGRV